MARFGAEVTRLALNRIVLAVALLSLPSCQPPGETSGAGARTTEHAGSPVVGPARDLSQDELIEQVRRAYNVELTGFGFRIPST